MSVIDEIREIRTYDPWLAYAWGVLAMLTGVLIIILVGLLAVVLWIFPWLALAALIIFGIPARIVLYGPKKERR